MPSRRVVIAFALSLFLHGVLFSVLALTSQFDPAREISTTETADDQPLEVVFQAAAPELKAAETPFRTEEKEPSLVMEMKMETDLAVERTQLDPAALKKSETAPEKPEFLASHHSLPSKAKAKNANLPQPTPVPSTSQPSFRTAPPTAPPEPDSAPAGEDQGEEGTIAAIGAWKKAVGNAIGARWDHYRWEKLDLLAIGSVRMKFTIDAQGRATNARVVANTASPTNATYAARSIAEAEIPPIPPDRLARLPGGRVEVEFTFIILPPH